ncbi:MAG: protease SohB [Gammaproteobacteria bacterium]|nr:protease SohB [Gammaproteobacteria bacterium]
MSEFFFAYGLFFAKVLTALIALVFAVAIIASARQKKDEGPELKVTNLNQKYRDLQMRLRHAVMNKKQFKQFAKQQQKSIKQQQKATPKSTARSKMFVLDFDGDIKATEVATLRDEITTMLSVAEPQDEVLLKLDNSGGLVHEHGLAASQLQRIKDAKLNFTVAVDKVAASGGYMMACVADKIIAAPFAILGSIGVLAQLPNFNRMLDKHGIDFEQHTAGEYKRTVTMFGKNSDKEREKLKLDLQETHRLFREFVAGNRPKLNIDEVATGEHWYGLQALDRRLIDEVKTSDEFLVDAINDYDIYQIKMEIKKPLQERIVGGLGSISEGLRNRFAAQQNDSKYL